MTAVAATPMARGWFTISIDLELAWGVWDKLTDERMRQAEQLERPIVRELLAHFERFDVPVTWATVGRVFDERGNGRRGAGWFAPDIVERIRAARTAHEIASHGYDHSYFDELDAAGAREDLERSAELFRRHGLALESFVFPRNQLGHLDALADARLITFRSRDQGMLAFVERRAPYLRRPANFIDKMLPLSPAVVGAELRGRLVEQPSSLLLLARGGLRRLVPPSIVVMKCVKGLDAAERHALGFHLWFHPSNFYFQRGIQFSVLEQVLRHARKRVDDGRLTFATMGEVARRVTARASVGASPP